MLIEQFNLKISSFTCYMMESKIKNNQLDKIVMISQYLYAIFSTLIFETVCSVMISFQKYQYCSIDYSDLQIIYNRLYQQYIAMKQEEFLEDYDDQFAGLSPEILKNLYIRFYTMEDYFQFALPESEPIKVEAATSMQPQKAETKKVQPVYMYYNRIIQQCIQDLYIMNKLIYSKAKLVHAILENGRGIAQKKVESWNDFIDTKGFQMVRAAFDRLPWHKKDIIKFAVLSISNLLLKLSINMSKVSVIPIQKFLNYQCLNIPTLSVIFLQNLQYRLFKSKNIDKEDQQAMFMKQLPKITFIKLNKYKNNTDFMLLEKSQQTFISKEVKQTVRNLQYIEIHEHSRDPIMPEYKRTTDYPYFYRLDLETMSNCRSPFKFEVLEIMRQIVFLLVKDFKPDLIVYMESYPNDGVVMDDEVRALMLCEMAQETTCNKIYVFKQLGLDKLSIKAYESFISEQGEVIDDRIDKIFNDEEAALGKKMVSKVLPFNKNPKQKESLQKIKKIFIDELCYTSLALIQKTSFESISEQSHKHFFKQNFLQGIEKQLTILMDKENKKDDSLKNYLKKNKEGIKIMLEVLKFKSGEKSSKIINLANREVVFKNFYNLHEGTLQDLVVQGMQNEKHFYFYTEEDHLIVKYFETMALVIIIKNIVREKGETVIQHTFLSKSKQKTAFMRLQAVVTVPCLHIEGPTYICSNEYLYRAFGRVKGGNNQEYNDKVHRIRIYPEIGKEWETVADQGINMKPDGKEQGKIPFEKKVHGYGIFDLDSKAILMMGGYIDSSNEERISKTICYIKNPDNANPKQLKALVIGKTNKIVYSISGKTSPIFLYPFVFGLPFYFGAPLTDKGAFILNSNGKYLNLNNSNKIFTSVVKLSSTLVYNGVNVQNKLKISEDVEKAAVDIFLAEIIGKCLVMYPHQLNVKGSVCCIQTLEQGCILMEANMKQKWIKIATKDIFDDDKPKLIQFQ